MQNDQPLFRRALTVGIVWILAQGIVFSADKKGFPPAQIEVPYRTAEELKAEGVPEYLKGAKIYVRTHDDAEAQEKVGIDGVGGGRTDFKVITPGVVFLLANWKRDGNEAGGWKKEVQPLEALVRDGWRHLGACPWNEEDELFVRVCTRGNTFALRSKKYTGPRPIIPSGPIPSEIVQGKPLPAPTIAPLTQNEVATLPTVEAVERDRSLWLKWLDDRQYSKLEAIATELRKRPVRYRDGRNRLVAFYAALGKFDPRPENLSDQDFIRRLDTLGAWQKAMPKSLTVRIAKATALNSWGWFARGGGYANSVTDADAQRLYRRAEQASELLDEVADLTKNPDCGYYVARIDISLSLSKRPQDEWVTQALQQDPSCREVVNEMARALLPQWYGKPGELEQFAEDVVVLTKGDVGQFHYTQVALVAWMFNGDVAWGAYEFDWPRVREGFRDWERLSPNSREHLNRYARLAVLAGDYETARNVFAKIGTEIDLQIWVNAEEFRDWNLHIAPETHEGDQQQLIVAHQSPIVALTLSPDGKTAVTTDKSGVLRIHELETGKRRSTIPLQGSKPDTVTVSGPAVLLAAAVSQRPGIVLMHLATSEVGVLEQGKQPTVQLIFSPDGKRLAAGDQAGMITLFNTQTGAIHRDIPSAKNRPVATMSFSADGKQLAVGSEKGLVEIFSAETGELLREWTAGPAKIITLAWSPSGHRLAVADREFQLRIYDLPKQTLRVEWKADLPFPEALDFSPDGKQLAIGLCGRQYYGRLEHPLRIWNYETEKAPTPLNGHHMGVRRVAFTADGKRLVSASYDWTIRVWDIKAAP